RDRPKNIASSYFSTSRGTLTSINYTPSIALWGASQAHHLLAHPVAHLDSSDQHQHGKHRLAKITPHSVDGGHAFVDVCRGAGGKSAENQAGNDDHGAFQAHACVRFEEMHAYAGCSFSGKGRQRD